MAEPTPSSSSEAQQQDYRHALGETVSFEATYAGVRYDYRVTVLDSKKITEAQLPEISGERFGVLVKTCLKAGQPVEFTLFQWSVRAGDGARYEAQSYQPGAIPGPEYGVQTIAPGTCLKGWIPYEVDDASEIKATVYTPDTGDSYTEWSLRE